MIDGEYVTHLTDFAYNWGLPVANTSLDYANYAVKPARQHAPMWPMLKTCLARTHMPKSDSPTSAVGYERVY